MRRMQWKIIVAVVTLSLLATWKVLNNVAFDSNISSSLVGKATSPSLHRSEVKFDSVIFPRIFEHWSAHTPIPCTPAPSSWLRDQNRRDLITTGLLYTKLHKCASTSSASVHLRIARNLAIRNGYRNTFCESYFAHNKIGHSDGTPPYGYATRYGERNRRKSFLWSTVRQPTDRYVSQYFYSQVSKGGKNYSDTGLINFINDHHVRNSGYYIQSLNTRGFDPSTDQPSTAIQQILNDYDFIAVAERFAESLVALMMILRLNIGDVLFLDGKTPNGFVNGGFQNPGSKCFRVVEPFVTPTMQAFFDTSEKWKEVVYWDKVLYDAVNMSLDLTIDYLGRKEFEANLDMFKKASRAAQYRCKDHIVSTCPITQTRTNCVGTDIACGQRCLDDVVRDFDLGISFDLSSTKEPYEFSTLMHRSHWKSLQCIRDPARCDQVR